MMSFSAAFFRKSALVTYFLLFAWVGLWHSILSPHPHISSLGVTLGWLLPLCFPLLGITKGNPYTHAWANFILMFYFLHALTILWVNEGERLLAAIELMLTSFSFISNLLYAKKEGQKRGIGLKRLSEVEKEEKQQYS